MKIGVPTEIKKHEHRVGLVPGFVRELSSRGHQVMLQTQAGQGIGCTDEEYVQAGALIGANAEEVFGWADMIVKVKEPQLEEGKYIKQDQILFTYLHLAPDLAQTKMLLESGCTAIAYETVEDEFGRLPLLVPMSEIAGRLGIQQGAHHLEKHGAISRGMLMGGIAGVAPANVLILGGGAAGTQSIRMALGAEASVTVIDRSVQRLRELKAMFPGQLRTLYSTADTIDEEIAQADLVVGSVLIPGASAPKLINRQHLSLMRKGAVIVDIAIDQGGCAESARPTTFSEPTYVEEDVVHYCVTNMPGAVPRTSTYALNNATWPYIALLADKGVKAACQSSAPLLRGVNICKGQITHPAVAESQKREYVDPLSIL